MSRKTWGITLIVVPPLIFLITQFLYAILQFVALQGSINITVMKIINILFSLIGIVSVIGIIVGIPLGVYLLVKKNPTKPSSDTPTTQM